MYIRSGKSLAIFIASAVLLTAIVTFGSPPTPGPPIGGGPCEPVGGSCFSNRQCCSGICNKGIDQCGTL
ncbi:unnamed protein product [Allacma fusca]|uniref:Uncharacterized protein n=1 Tax=Allacma fusca TaxID=39272 RepID=A0A8J2J7X0_9HEXA|nr:unnamed protein product [Allacma fusca]